MNLQTTFGILKLFIYNLKILTKKIIFLFTLIYLRFIHDSMIINNNIFFYRSNIKKEISLNNKIIFI